MGAEAQHQQYQLWRWCAREWIFQPRRRSHIGIPSQQSAIGIEAGDLREGSVGLGSFSACLLGLGGWYFRCSERFLRFQSHSVASWPTRAEDSSNEWTPSSLPRKTHHPPLKRNFYSSFFPHNAQLPPFIFRCWFTIFLVWHLLTEILILFKVC